MTTLLQPSYIFEVGGSISPFPTISPNAKHIAFLASEPGKERQIWRSLDEVDARLLQGTDNAVASGNSISSARCLAPQKTQRLSSNGQFELEQ